MKTVDIGLILVKVNINSYALFGNHLYVRITTNTGLLAEKTCRKGYMETKNFIDSFFNTYLVDKEFEVTYTGDTIIPFTYTKLGD